MPARPSTSSGPGSSRSADVKPGWDKRTSRDDIALTRTGMAMGSSLHPSAGAVRVFTPEPSFPKTGMISASPAAMSAASGVIPIGMALGSPSQDSASFPVSPQPGWWQPQTQTSVQAGHDHSLPPVRSSSHGHGHPPPPAQTRGPPVQRSKTQKRRLFTSLFGGRKHTESSKTVSLAEADRVVSPTPARRPQGGDPAVPVRSNTVASKKTPKHRPIIIIKSTEEPGAHTDAAPSKGPTVSVSACSASTGGAGFLNVEIPDIRLERYSVMFSDVLKPGESKSSLLERRQATLGKLKTISDRIEQEERDDRTRPRRATSPQPMKSPAFSLFPQTPSRQSVAMAITAAGTASTTPSTPPYGLNRSSTSPACLPTPSRASFEPLSQPLPGQPKKEKTTVSVVSPRIMDERTRTARAERLQEQQTRSQARTTAPSATSSCFHPNGSSLVLGSPPPPPPSVASSPSTSSTEAESSSSPAGRPSFRPEPEWEIATPARTGTALDSVEEEDAALKAAVEISIARQISISRQQRRMLGPFVRPGGGASPAAKDKNKGAGPSSSSKPDQPAVGGLNGKVMPVMVGPRAAGGWRRERVVLDVAE
ncbi:hypothetical protein VTH06DRAFT_2044 [Thermothelomyces fergusii]